MDHHHRIIDKLPLAASVFGQREYFTIRNLDARWNYSDTVPVNISGFNPLTFSVFIPRISYLSSYLFSTELAELGWRPNWLRYELLYSIHDFVHARVVAECFSVLYGNVRTKHTLPHSKEFAVFVLSLSEVSATVGLDYWHICQLNAPRRKYYDELFITPLTTDYYAEVDGAVNQSVMHPDFYIFLLGFYGFHFGSRRTLQDHPLMQQGWISREARQAGRFVETAARFLSIFDAPVVLDDSERGSARLLLDHILNWTWRVFVDHDYHLLNMPTLSDANWPLQNFSECTFSLDPRFFNINSFPNIMSLIRWFERRSLSRHQFKYLAAQAIGRLKFDSDVAAQIDFNEVKLKNDYSTLLDLWERVEVVPGNVEATKALIFPN
ncbi:hypothetical protein V1T76_08735 [Roseibium sp. FZY0029]|uniref:hypothetical protein n=1 Tax=Roseibium sp. FZY0029 TaxID=3116647 RepID=UPI002E983406|nr:hypothetical protein [Roseibium sp. FZY0029]